MRVTVTAETAPEAVAEELANFIRDIVFLHDRIMLLGMVQTEPKYFWTPGFYRRDINRLSPEYRLRIASLSKESPIQIELVLGIAAVMLATAKTFVELLKLIRDWRLDRESKELQNEKLRAEIAKILENVDMKKVSPEEQTHLEKLLKRDFERLAESAIQISAVQVKDE